MKKKSQRLRPTKKPSVLIFFDPENSVGLNILVASVLIFSVLVTRSKTFRATNGTETFLGTGRRTSVRKTLWGSSRLSFFFINCRKTITVLTLPYSIGTLFNERTFEVYPIWLHNIQSIKELALTWLTNRVVAVIFIFKIQQYCVGSI